MAKTEKGGLRAGRPYLSTRRSIPEWRTKSRNFCRASTDPSVRGSTRLSESSGLGEGAGICVVAAEGGEHLLGQSGKERRVVLAVHLEGVLSRTETALHIGHGTHRRPIFAE